MITTFEKLLFSHRYDFIRKSHEYCNSLSLAQDLLKSFHSVWDGGSISIIMQLIYSKLIMIESMDPLHKKFGAMHILNVSILITFESSIENW